MALARRKLTAPPRNGGIRGGVDAPWREFVHRDANLEALAATLWLHVRFLRLEAVKHGDPIHYESSGSRRWRFFDVAGVELTPDDVIDRADRELAEFPVAHRHAWAAALERP